MSAAEPLVTIEAAGDVRVQWPCHCVTRIKLSRPRPPRTVLVADCGRAGCARRTSEAEPR